VQRWTDSSISKTVNVPSNFTVEQTKKVYELGYDLGCKGLTVYVDNSRTEQILSTSADTEHKNVKSAEGHDEKKEDIKISEHSRIIEPEKKEENVVYGSSVGNRCPSCKQGTMVKIGGCTECSNQCGFKGSCEV